MSQHRRAADRERQAARILGVERVKRKSRYESAPDIKLVTLKDGTRLAPEVKTRKSLPKYLSSALSQAASYAPKGAEPVAVISAKGGRALVVIDAKAFARIAGLEPEAADGGQLKIATVSLPTAGHVRHVEAPALPVAKPAPKVFAAIANQPHELSVHDDLAEEARSAISFARDPWCPPDVRDRLVAHARRALALVQGGT